MSETISVPGADRPTLDALVAFIKARLVQPVMLREGETQLAVSETAERFNNTTWFWTDDNAKAAELLCEPACYGADPAAADAAINFVLQMSQGDVIQRRGGPAELRVLSADPAAFRVETAFVFLEGDLTRGDIRHGLRFNDNRAMTAAHHAGNWVSFRRSGRRFRLSVEDDIVGWAVQQDQRHVSLSFTSTLRQRARWRRGGAGRVLGQIVYAYRVSADCPTIALSVTLTPAPGIRLKDVVITTALDRLVDAPNDGYRLVGVRAGEQNRILRGIRSQAVFHIGPADYAVVAQEGASPGFAYAIHMHFRDGERLARIAGLGGSGGRLQWLVNSYAVGDVGVGASASIREDRMVTGGGYYEVLEQYADVMRRAAGAGHAIPSMTYDIGAELNAVAVHILFARSGRYAVPPSPGRLASLTTWYDRHVQRYFDAVKAGSPNDLGRVFTRGLAFVVLSLDCMLRVTGDSRYRVMLATGVGLILRLAKTADRTGDTAVTFADVWEGQMAFLDCHAACILALARAAWHGDPDGAIGRAVHAGIQGIRLYSGPIDIGRGHLEPYDGLAVLGTLGQGTHADTGFWHFKLGLVLRALHAVTRAEKAGLIAMSAGERDRLERRLSLAGDLLASAFRRHGAMLEVLTSCAANETNSETQPWVALGLDPIVDELIAGCGFGPFSPPAFSEESYLRAHADVREAVAQGIFTSGLDHWRTFGATEGRALV